MGSQEKNDGCFGLALIWAAMVGIVMFVFLMITDCASFNAVNLQDAEGKREQIIGAPSPELCRIEHSGDTTISVYRVENINRYYYRVTNRRGFTHIVKVKQGVKYGGH